MFSPPTPPPPPLTYGRAGHRIQVGQVLRCLLTSVSNPKALGVTINPVDVNKSLVSLRACVASGVTRQSEVVIGGEEQMLYMMIDQIEDF